MPYQFKLAPVREAFESYVDTDIPNATATVKHCKNYEEFKNSWSEYEDIRALTTIINWKSNVGNADQTHNFRTKLEVDLDRGDYIYDSATNSVGIVSWNVDVMPDCKRSQVTGCNAMTTVRRMQDEVLDDELHVITPKTEIVIAENYPVSYSAMYGRYDYEMRRNAPAIFPDQKIEVKIQYNSVTKTIRSGDLLVLRGIEHRVMFVSYATIDMDELHGVLLLTCERVAG